MFGGVKAVLIRESGVSDQQVSSFSLIEQYAAAAYCKDNNDAVGNITCSAGNCPQVESAGATSVVEFEE